MRAVSRPCWRVTASGARGPPGRRGAPPGRGAALGARAGGADGETARERRLALDDLLRIRAAAGHPPVHVVRYGGVAHNVMRYRPDEVSAELLRLLVAAAAGGARPSPPPPPPR